MRHSLRITLFCFLLCRIYTSTLLAALQRTRLRGVVVGVSGGISKMPPDLPQTSYPHPSSSLEVSEEKLSLKCRFCWEWQEVKGRGRWIRERCRAHGVFRLMVGWMSPPAAGDFRAANNSIVTDAQVRGKCTDSPSHTVLRVAPLEDTACSQGLSCLWTWRKIGRVYFPRW